VVYRHVAAAHDGLAEVVEAVVCLGEGWSAGLRLHPKNGGHSLLCLRISSSVISGK
jgi:hypothetical protein